MFFMENPVESVFCRAQGLDYEIARTATQNKHRQKSVLKLAFTPEMQLALRKAEGIRQGARGSVRNASRHICLQLEEDDRVAGMRLDGKAARDQQH